VKRLRLVAYVDGIEVDYVENDVEDSEVNRVIGAAFFAVEEPDDEDDD